MAYTHKEGKGTVFLNEKKQTDTHPDFKGTCRFEGHDCRVSLWETTINGVQAYSLSLQRKDGTSTRPKADERPTAPGGSAEGKAFIESQKKNPTFAQAALDDETPF
jgi:hypothetical protein